MSSYLSCPTTLDDAIRYLWGHRRLTRPLVDAVLRHTADSGGHRWDWMVYDHHPALVVPSGATPRLSLTDLGVQRADDVLDQLATGAALTSLDELICAGLWVAGAVPGPLGTVSARRQRVTGSDVEGCLGRKRRSVTVAELAATIGQMAPWATDLPARHIVEAVGGLGAEVRMHRPAPDVTLLPEWWEQATPVGQMWPWMRRCEEVAGLDEWVAAQADWLAEHQRRRRERTSTLGPHAKAELEALGVTQTAIARLLDHDRDVVRGCASLTALRGIDVYAEGQRFPGLQTRLRSRATTQRNRAAVRETFRIPDAMVWRHADRPGAPSLLIEYEAARRPPLVTRHVLDGIAYSALWQSPTMTVCVVVSPDAEARVVRDIAALPDSAEFRAVKTEYPDGAVTVRILARRTAVTTSVLSGPALLEVTL